MLPDNREPTIHVRHSPSLEESLQNLIRCAPFRSYSAHDREALPLVEVHRIYVRDEGYIESLVAASRQGDSLMCLETSYFVRLCKGPLRTSTRLLA